MTRMTKIAKITKIVSQSNCCKFPAQCNCHRHFNMVIIIGASNSSLNVWV